MNNRFIFQEIENSASLLGEVSTLIAGRTCTKRWKVTGKDRGYWQENCTDYPSYDSENGGSQNIGLIAAIIIPIVIAAYLVRSQNNLISKISRYTSDARYKGSEALTSITTNAKFKSKMV